MQPEPSVSRCSIRLPNTCPQNKRSFIHIRLISGVREDAWNGAGFAGELFRVGAKVSPQELGEHPVLLEFAGPQGVWQKGKRRPNLWILWRYDWDAKDWREIARVLAYAWEWAPILRGAAIDALHPVETAAVDAVQRGREVTDELLQSIDAALKAELPAVRALVLTSIYDGMAGRIVAA